MQFHETFRAMGTDVDVIIEAHSPPIDAFLSVRLLFDGHEALFSRFQPESLLSRLNAGQTVEHPAFATVCRLALEAHAFTGGIFNPMVLRALEEAGYDRSFESVSGGHPREQPVPDPNDCIVLEGDRVRLRQGALDLGGVVKGWTVDRATELTGERFEGVLINAGGDLRGTGCDGARRGWSVEVASPGGGIAWTGRLDGALATSTALKRRWKSRSGNTAHHLIDPRTGVPARAVAAQASVWGRETWRAECWAKAIVIGGVEVAKWARDAGFEILALDQDASQLLVDRIVAADIG
jgi:FAD:protein FMN transferase